MNVIFRTACAVLCAGAITSAGAAGNDELWEVTTQMNMAGLPAGMGARTQQVCTEKADPKQAAQRNMEKCKITDYKRSGNRVTIAMSCPEGTAVLENTYNVAGTEYKGSMKMTTRDGEMAMTMAGRKVGNCDAQQAKSAQQAQVAAMQGQAAKIQADAAASSKASMEREISNCKLAVNEMDFRKLGLYGTCHEHPNECKTMASIEHLKPVATACTQSHTEFCRRYRTMDGFLKAKGDEQGAKSCNVSTAALKAEHCPQAMSSERLDYLGRFCPVEAKPLAQQHCAGRSYTSRAGGKYSAFCEAYLAQNSLDEEPAAAAPKSAIDKAVTQGVQQGINKLKGLFGR